MTAALFFVRVNRLLEVFPRERRGRFPRLSTEPEQQYPAPAVQSPSRQGPPYDMGLDIGTGMPVCSLIARSMASSSSSTRRLAWAASISLIAVPCRA